MEDIKIIFKIWIPFSDVHQQILTVVVPHLLTLLNKTAHKSLSARTKAEYELAEHIYNSYYYEQTEVTVETIRIIIHMTAKFLVPHIGCRVYEFNALNVIDSHVVIELTELTSVCMVCDKAYKGHDVCEDGCEIPF